MNIYPGTEWKIEAYRALSYLYERGDANNADSNFLRSLSEALDANLFRECVWCGNLLTSWTGMWDRWDHFPPRPENAIGGHKAEPISVYAQRLPALKAIAP